MSQNQQPNHRQQAVGRVKYSNIVNILEYFAHMALPATKPLIDWAKTSGPAAAAMTHMCATCPRPSLGCF